MKKEDVFQVKLRALEPEDIDLLFDWENNPENWAVTNTLAPFSRLILQSYLDNSHLDIYQTRQLRLMIDVLQPSHAAVTVGAIDLFDFDPYHLRAGVGVLIAEKEYRGKGIAGLALQHLADYAFGILQLHQLFCNIAVGNASSIKLFEAAGFSCIGTKKEWLKTREGFEDELFFQLLRRNVPLKK